jgi:ribosomal protein S18 acetylase RimI-like enzyme
MRELVIRPMDGDDEARAGATFMSTTDPWLRLGRGFDGCLGALTDPTCETYVAVDGSAAPLGYVIINMRGAFIGYIRTVIVAPGARDRGIGTRLVAFAEYRIFRETPNVFLCVSSFNTRARALYERLGYEVIGVMPDYLVRGYDEILMRKSIAPFAEFRPALDEHPTES